MWRWSRARLRQAQIRGVVGHDEFAFGVEHCLLAIGGVGRYGDEAGKDRLHQGLPLPVRPPLQLRDLVGVSVDVEGEETANYGLLLRCLFGHKLGHFDHAGASPTWMVTGQSVGFAPS